MSVVGQSIGVATKSSGFTGYDGIIGFGPVDLTEGTVSGSTTVPTFLDNLYSKGTIVSFASATRGSFLVLELIIGLHISRLSRSVSTSSPRAARTLPMLTVN